MLFRIKKTVFSFAYRKPIPEVALTRLKDESSDILWLFQPPEGSRPTRRVSSSIGINITRLSTLPDGENIKK